MLINKRKIRPGALSSIVCRQAGPPVQTLRAGRIWPLRALEKLENRPGFRHFPVYSEAKSASQNGWN